MCILVSRTTVDAAPQYHSLKKKWEKNQLDAIIIRVYWLQVCSGWLDKLNEKFLDREILCHTTLCTILCLHRNLHIMLCLF